MRSPAIPTPLYVRVLFFQTALMFAVSPIGAQTTPERLFSLEKDHERLQESVLELKSTTAETAELLEEVDGIVSSQERKLSRIENEVSANSRTNQVQSTVLEDTTSQVRGLSETNQIFGNDLSRIDRSQDLLREDTDNNRQSISKNSANISFNKSSIEVNREDINNTTINVSHLNRFWVLICAALVFFMQAGFLCLEKGMVRQHHRHLIGLKNLGDWIVVSIFFYLFGFGLMFGEDFSGFIGTNLWFPNPGTTQYVSPTNETIMAAHNQGYDAPASFYLGFEFFLFQVAFATTSATIVSGALAERVKLGWYMLVSLMTCVLYSVVGHWAWGHLFLGEGSTGWLAGLREESSGGFYDFAGSTVVHSVGAWVALAGTVCLGPRTGRFDKNDGNSIAPYDLGTATLGVFILILGWWGFNGGSQLRYDNGIGSIVLNTIAAAAVGGAAAYLIDLLWCVFQGRAVPNDLNTRFSILIGGVLGGLVAVTAPADTISVWQACFLGLLAGLVHNAAYYGLEALKIDDPVGAVPVHGACGVLGTLFVAFGEHGEGRVGQSFITQLESVFWVFVFVTIPATLFFLAFRKHMRIPLDEETGDSRLTGEPLRFPALPENRNLHVAVSVALFVPLLVTLLAYRTGNAPVVQFYIGAVGVMIATINLIMFFRRENRA